MSRRFVSHPGQLNNHKKLKHKKKSQNVWQATEKNREKRIQGY